MKQAIIFFLLLINLFNFANQWCLETCKTGQYCEYYTICRECNLENCEDCSSSSDCTKCLDGFYMEDSSCKQCPSQCSTCTTITECQSCNEGYYKSGGACFNCPNGCATCSNTGSSCSSCLAGYYLNGTQCWNCMWNCAKVSKIYYCYSLYLKCTEPSSCDACEEKFTGPHCQCQEPKVWNSTSQTCVESQNWAVLICGSSGFKYYRHQADVCHAYQTLLNKGIAADNIIVFSYNDAPLASDNPYKGKLFNKPCERESDCWDVYKGCKIDYAMGEVLSGNESAMKSVGSGKVLKSNSTDNVLIYYVDDGGKGILGVPGGDYIYANNLSYVLDSLHNDNRYNQLALYIDGFFYFFDKNEIIASKSASMVYNYPSSLHIYCLTSANTTGQSYGVYCDDEVMGVHIDTCLGDMFSVNWLQTTDEGVVSQITLEEQYQEVKKLTTNSTVSQWGDKSFTGEPIGDFMGQNAMSNEDESNCGGKALSNRDIQVELLKTRWLKDYNNLTKKIEYFEEVIKNDKATLFFTRIAYDTKRSELLEENNQIEIKNWDCYKASIELYEQKCMKLTGFSKYYLNVLAGLCEDERNVNPIYFLNEKIKQYC